ncbi:hypothetical protein NDU88_005825 [Pleurodeles waltl]|uniref:Uncharacterized protein n=1 Tax=Pleurodeles waltl TaxID=8319 RepID=A0AAV7UKL5_PLEWA|nr:hypothetical protein NDU88_005825 [Pleurodeles waltl]
MWTPTRSIPPYPWGTSAAVVSTRIHTGQEPISRDLRVTCGLVKPFAPYTGWTGEKEKRRPRRGTQWCQTGQRQEP